MRRRIFWYQDWHIYDLLSRESTQFTEGYFREKSTKMHKTEHRSILTESVPKVAPIELPDSAFESANVSEQNSQPHRVLISLPYAFSKARLLKKLENSQSQSFTLWALESSEKRLPKTRVTQIPTPFFQGLHAPYTRFPPNSPLRMAASTLFTEKLEKSTFFVQCHFLVDMIIAKSFSWRALKTHIRCSFSRPTTSL